MGRPLPKLDRTRPFGTVSPITPEGIAFEQDGYPFDVNGRCLENCLDEKQVARHFGDGVESDRILVGSSRHPEKIAISDTIKLVLGDVVAKAHKTSGLSVAEWNGLPQDERDDLIDREVDWFKSSLGIETSRPTSQIGAKAEAAAPPAEPREPGVYAPIDPPSPTDRSGPEPVKPAEVDLRAWYRGDAKYPHQTVVSAVKQRYKASLRTAEAIRTYLREEQGYGG